MLGISQSTLHRRMSEYGLSIRVQYSGISESELGDLISQAMNHFLMLGTDLFKVGLIIGD